jgi:hypothetical protein
LHFKTFAQLKALALQNEKEYTNVDLAIAWELYDRLVSDSLGDI